MAKCTCYVQYLPEETQFGLHYGAHNPSCPVYRVSRDPVDRKNDEEYCREMEAAVRYSTAELIRTARDAGV